MSSEIKVDIEAGSLRYMPPEILSGTNKVVGPNIDIWAMGCILYGMVCGELPFKGESNREIVEKICHADFSFSKDNEKRLSYEVKDLIRHILVPNPEERYTLKDISNHPWILEEKMKYGFSCLNETYEIFRVEEVIPEKVEETKERKPTLKDRKITLREVKPLNTAKPTRSESVKVRQKSTIHSPLGSPEIQNTSKRGSTFFRSDSAGLAEALAQMSKGSRNK